MLSTLHSPRRRCKLGCVATEDDRYDAKGENMTVTTEGPRKIKTYGSKKHNEKRNEENVSVPGSVDSRHVHLICIRCFWR